MTKVFWDFEFTGLHAKTTPISLGCAASNGKQFYAEFEDYDRSQVDAWIQKNVIDNLQFGVGEPLMNTLGDYTLVKGTTVQVMNAFIPWVKQFDHVEFWGDCLSYDGVLLNEVLGGALGIPKNVDYIFYDICTLFKMFGIDPDISRESFIDRPIEGDKHNALYDAKVIKACYDKLYRNRFEYKVKF